MSNHEAFLREAFDLAREAAQSGNRPFGSLLVVDQEVVNTANNTTVTDNDIIAHPELKLARWSAKNLSDAERDAATLYTSTEPCPMCSGAIYWSGLRRIVYSSTSAIKAKYAGPQLVMSCEAVFENGYDEVEVIGPLLPAEGEAVHEEYW